MFALIVFSPVMLWAAYKIRKEDKGPIFFCQERIGYGAKPFITYKFRTMFMDAEARANILFRDDDIKSDYEETAKLREDPRLTKIGAFLRKTSIDELPQLFNILKGDMSLIGPRPQLVRDMVFFTPEEMKRQSVLPGLTGLAQINGRNNIDWKERFRYDLEYIRNITLLGDMKIFWQTIFKVGAREDIATDGMETSEDYGDWLLRKKMITRDEYEIGQIRAKAMLRKFLARR